MDFLLLLLLLVSLLMLASLLLLVSLPYGVFAVAISIEIPLILLDSHVSSLGRYVFGSEISYNKPPPRLPGLGC